MPSVEWSVWLRSWLILDLESPLVFAISHCQLLFSLKSHYRRLAVDADNDYKNYDYDERPPRQARGFSVILCILLQCFSNVAAKSNDDYQLCVSLCLSSVSPSYFEWPAFFFPHLFFTGYRSWRHMSSLRSPLLRNDVMSSATVPATTTGSLARPGQAKEERETERARRRLRTLARLLACAWGQ